MQGFWCTGWDWDQYFIEHFNSICQSQCYDLKKNTNCRYTVAYIAIENIRHNVYSAQLEVSVPLVKSLIQFMRPTLIQFDLMILKPNLYK